MRWAMRLNIHTQFCQSTSSTCIFHQHIRSYYASLCGVLDGCEAFSIRCHISSCLIQHMLLPTWGKDTLHSACKESLHLLTYFNIMSIFYNNMGKFLKNYSNKVDLTLKYMRECKQYYLPSGYKESPPPPLECRRSKYVFFTYTKTVN
jgi:hypothetical protein